MPKVTSGTLRVDLANQTSSNRVYAYITGRAIDNNNALFLLRSDGKTPFYPSSPSAIGSNLPADIAISLGGPGNTIHCIIPRIAGGRIWFSVDQPLVFKLNPGPALVEPSVTNPTDPNININWSFAEFTYNSFQLFANITYVDFVGVPIALTLTGDGHPTQHVSGMRENGVDLVANGLRAQEAKDGRKWSALIVQSGGRNLRVLSPNNVHMANPDLFKNYWDPYVDQVWNHYRSVDVAINTQAGYGNVRGRVANNNQLAFQGAGGFNRPSAMDIFSSNTGPFATGSNQERNTVIPRLAAAFNRSTLLLSNNHPNGVRADQYYKNPITNHYSRIVHETNLDKKGYGFPYDDVTPDGGEGQEGAVASGNPTLFTLTVGGRNAHT
ncbi:glycoside hydrolase family 64 protein [Patellaria atrata CBS 101060]|uniref:Glycoside hydrolase family 64 protein n=1 Tax=Patellaria atrata CBS 101060 TaxID=1346257 RepID=A0A9P4SEL5_9PEZI|nr:glycoside hydrolase family 64 protein [Patellaria atrata CBS 101060]